MTYENALHPFEQAGLGAAPFRFVGMEQKIFVAAPGTPGKPGGTCQFCGNGIKNCCWIESADKKRFYVGTDCVAKLGRADNALVSAAKKAVLAEQREKSRLKRQAKQDAELATIQAAEKLLKESSSIRERLAAQPHPNAYFYEQQGMTLLDYAEWTFSRGSHSARLSWAKTILEK